MKVRRAASDTGPAHRTRKGISVDSSEASRSGRRRGRIGGENFDIKSMEVARRNADLDDMCDKRTDYPLPLWCANV